MNDSLTVSVIIPTFNRADYLREALDSILKQTFPPWEIIVIDDGSTDHTSAMIQEFDVKVRYYRHETNMRISASRNHGLEVARGDVIAWLDADDLWEPNYLVTVIPLLAADEKLDGVYTGLVRIDADGKLLPQSSTKVVSPAQLHWSLIEGCFIQTSTLVLRRACFERVGHFDLQFDICEDLDMFLRLAESCNIIGVPKPLVRYRVHPQNITKDVSGHCQARLAVAQKHFGRPDGDPESWPAEKRRAHGFAFRAAAFKYFQANQKQQGWSHLAKAVSIWPELLNRLDTYYELAFGSQPMGQRGQAELLDLEAQGADILNGLGQFFDQAGPLLQPMRRLATGNALMVLGLLSDQAHRPKLARRYLLSAVITHRPLLRNGQLLRKWLKTYLGSRLPHLVSRLRSGNMSGRLPSRSPESY